MSINERLGALCGSMGAHRAGADLTPLDGEWLTDVAAADLADAEEIDEARREATDRARHDGEIH